MKNDIYSILNEADIDLNEYKKEDFNDIEKKLLKKNIRKSIKGRKHKVSRKMTAAVAITLVVVSMSFGNTRAYALSKVNLLGESIASSLGINKNLENYNTVINKSVMDNGVTVKLNEVILDENELIISTNVSSDRILKEYEAWDSDMTLYINNKKVKFTGASGGSKNIDDYTTQQVLEYDLDSIKDVDLSGDLSVKIMYSKMTVNFADDDINGTWKFEFNTNGDQLKIDTKTINLNEKYQFENGNEYILEKYTDNALGQKIYGKIIHNSSSNETYAILLKGYDDLGNKIEFDLMRGRKDWFLLEYQNALYGNINEKASKLILTPYAVKMPETSGKEPDIDEYKKVGEEFTINIK